MRYTYREYTTLRRHKYTTLRRLHPDHAEKRYGSEDESSGVALWAVGCLAGACFLWALMTWWQA